MRMLNNTSTIAVPGEVTGHGTLLPASKLELLDVTWFLWTFTTKTKA